MNEALVEKAAYALERFRMSDYEWTDEQFEIWFNRDPRFVEQVHHWGNFSGTEKEKLFHEVRIVFSAISE